MMEEGFVACSKCDGRGTLEEDNDPAVHVRPCSKCWGAGKLDWIENVVGKRSFWGNTASRSCLDNINVRRLISYVRKHVEEICSSYIFSDHPDRYISLGISKFMQDLQDRRALCEYNVHLEPFSKYDFYIDIKPNASVEIVRIRVSVR
jgi:hypothetical protein